MQREANNIRTATALRPATVTRAPRNGDIRFETRQRGLGVLTSPQLNKGTAFTVEERSALGLTGLIPPEISTLAEQVKCAYVQYERLPFGALQNRPVSVRQN